MELITPERAQQLISSAVQNSRPVSAADVEKHVQELSDGTWIPGVAIYIDNGGRLIDGQHRMHAIVAHGQPVWTYVTYNASPDLYRHMDTGRRRLDVHSLQGDVTSKGISVLNALAGFCNLTTRSMCNSRRYDFWRANRSLDEFISSDPKLRGDSVLCAAIGAAWLHGIEPDSLVEFNRAVTTHEDMGHLSPARHAMRMKATAWLADNKLNAERASRIDNRLARYIGTQLLCRAWIANRRIRSVRLSNGEAYPVVVNPNTLQVEAWA